MNGHQRHRMNGAGGDSDLIPLELRGMLTQGGNACVRSLA